MVTQLLTADLEHTIPELLAGRSVVALVPATELLGWSAEMAWSVARAAAAGGRRTVLIDCFVDAPTLHDVSSEGNTEGLVDAFEYGASLNRIVRQQPQADLFFIPAGTYSNAPEPLMQHPRWKRLSAGFRHEEALLLLYVGAEHLGNLAAEPDGVIVLAPQGQGLAAAESPALAEAVGRGLPLLAVVADEDSVARASGAHSMPAASLPPEPIPAPVFVPEPEAVPVTDAPRRSRPVARASAPMAMLVENNPSSSRGLWSVIILVLAIGGLAAAYWFGGLAMIFGPNRSGTGTDAEVTGAGTATKQRPAPAPAPATSVPVSAPVAAVAESLPFVVQVASLPQLQDAFDLSDTLTARGVASLIAPSRIGSRAIYRVDAGPFATQRVADSVLAALRAARLLPAASGTALRLPLSFPLGAQPTRADAEAERARLRTAGIPAFILGQADGTFRLYAGAYEAPGQATLLQDLLTPTGSAGTLVPRAGYAP